MKKSGYENSNYEELLRQHFLQHRRKNYLKSVSAPSSKRKKRADDVLEERADKEVHTYFSLPSSRQF